MKTQFKTMAIVLFAFVTVVMMGCSKEDDTPTGGGDSGSLSLTQNGVNWTAATVTAARALELITVSGKDDSKQEIIFLLPDTIAVKSYDLSKGELGLLSITYVTKEGVPTYPNTGTLKITKYNRATNEFAGTFDFEATSLAGTDDVSVTNGKFDVKYDGAK